MTASIVDNALNTLNGSAAVDPYTGEVSPNGLTVELHLGDGPWYTETGVLVAPGFAPVDPDSGAFAATIPSTDVDITPSGAEYVAVFRRWGSVIATSIPFAAQEGATGRLADFVGAAGLGEGPMSGRELGYYEQFSDTFATAATSALAVITDADSTPLQLQSTFGITPILVEAFAESVVNVGGTGTVLGILVDGVIRRQGSAGYVALRLPAEPSVNRTFQAGLGSGAGGSGTVTATKIHLLIRDL